MTRRFTLPALILSAALAVRVAAAPTVTIKAGTAHLADGKPNCDLIVEAADARILDISLLNSGITRFLDDKGTDFGRKNADDFPDYEKGPYYPSSSTWGDIGPDKAILVTVGSMLKSHPGAARYTVEGTVRVKTATQSSEGKLNGVPFTKGHRLRFGAYDAEVTEVTVKDDKKELTIKILNPTDTMDIDEMELLDAKGDELRGSRNTMQQKNPDGTMYVSLWFYGLDASAEQATISYLIWNDAREQDVPYKLTIPMGSAAAPAPVAAVPPTVAPAKAAPAAASEPAAAPVAVEPAAQAEAVKHDETLTDVATGWPSITVSGIMGKGAKSSAMINGKIISIGQQVDGTTLVSTDKQSVVLRLGTETRTFKMGKPR